MEQHIFFSALSTSILVSLAQGAAIYLIAVIFLRTAPPLSAATRFQFLYGAMLLMFAGFVTAFGRAYSSKVAAAQMLTLHAAPVPSAQHFPPMPAVAPDYSMWIGVVYLGGILLQTALIIAGLYRLNAFRTKKTLWTDKVWEERLAALSRRLNIPTKVELHLAERIFSPFTAGFLKPVIVFPIAMLNRLTPEQVEAVLVHELAHIRRNDYVLNICHKCIETLLFFNPFVWLLSSGIRREREFACDDIVMQFTPDSTQYARALLHIAESKLKNYPLGIAAAGNTQLNLFKRIKRLTDMKSHQRNPKSALLAMLIVASALISLACIIPSDSEVPNVGKRAGIHRIDQALSTDSTQREISLPKPPKPLPPLRTVLKTPPPPPPPADTDTNHVGQHFQSAEWKKHIEDMKAHTAEMKKHFDSPEWKKHLHDMQLNAEEVKKNIDNPEWKKQMEEIKAHSAEMKKQFESPEFKKQIEDMRMNSEQMRSQVLAMQKEVESPEWKKRIEDIKSQAMEMRKKFDSPELKKKIAEMRVDSEELRKHFQSPEWTKTIDEIKKMAESIKAETDKEKKQAIKPEK